MGRRIWRIPCIEMGTRPSGSLWSRYNKQLSQRLRLSSHELSKTREKRSRSWNENNNNISKDVENGKIQPASTRSRSRPKTGKFRISRNRARGKVKRFRSFVITEPWKQCNRLLLITLKMKLWNWIAKLFPCRLNIIGKRKWWLISMRKVWKGKNQNLFLAKNNRSHNSK